MTKYSKELIERITIYFRDKYNHIIDEETAVEYLNSLGGMFSIFAEHEKEKSKKTTKS